MADFVIGYEMMVAENARLNGLAVRLAGQLADVRRRLKLLARRARLIGLEERLNAKIPAVPSFCSHAEGRAEMAEWAETEIRDILDAMEGKP